MAHDACRPCRIAASPTSSFEIRSSKGLETPGPCVTVLPRAGLDGPVSDGDGRRRRPHFNLVAPCLLRPRGVEALAPDRPSNCRRGPTTSVA